jgi:hypothetical protein
MSMEHLQPQRPPVAESISSNSPKTKDEWLISSIKGTITSMDSTQLETKLSTSINSTLNRKLLKTNLSSNCFSKVKRDQRMPLEGEVVKVILSRGLPLGTKIHPRIWALISQECMT